MPILDSTKRQASAQKALSSKRWVSETMATKAASQKLICPKNPSGVG